MSELLKRYQIVKGFITNEHDLIPLHDSRLKFIKEEDDGSNYYYAYIKDNYERLSYVREFIFDIEKKKYSAGIELDYYPEKTEFQKEEVVYYEVEHSTFKETKVVDIVFEEYDLDVYTGKNIIKYYKYLSDKISKEQENELFMLKRWKPFFILENGEKVEWEHQLKHKA